MDIEFTESNDKNEALFDWLNFYISALGMLLLSISFIAYVVVIEFRKQDVSIKIMIILFLLF